MDDIDAMLVVAAVVLGAGEAPVRQHDSVLSGDLYFEEKMATENIHRYLVLAGMNRKP